MEGQPAVEPAKPAPVQPCAAAAPGAKGAAQAGKADAEGAAMPPDGSRCWRCPQRQAPATPRLSAQVCFVGFQLGLLKGVKLEQPAAAGACRCGLLCRGGPRRWSHMGLSDSLGAAPLGGERCWQRQAQPLLSAQACTVGQNLEL